VKETADAASKYLLASASHRVTHPLRLRPRPGRSRKQRAKLSARNEVAKAITYSLNQWRGLVRFLDDGTPPRARCK
jgi:hypothetical protein